MATMQVLVSFGGNGRGTNGGGPRDSLFADAQGNLYGTTYAGGANGEGTVFELARTNVGAAGAPTYAASPTVLVAFTGSGFGSNGANPTGNLITDAEGNLYGTTSFGSSSNAGTVFEIMRTNVGASGPPTYATTPTTLYTFSGNGRDGGAPFGSLIADSQGNLYGTTFGGDFNGMGTVFEIARTNPGAAGTPTYAAAPTILASFGGASSGTNGGSLEDSLIADAQGNLYGTTYAGGANGAGTVFEITRTNPGAAGAPTYADMPTTLVSFGGPGSGTDGGSPGGSLIADAQGNLYGTTSRGGLNGAGTVFEIARTNVGASGAPTYATAPTTLVSFAGIGPGTDGGTPLRSLIADSKGNLFGTTNRGGDFGDGTVFEIARTNVGATGAPTYASAPNTLISFNRASGGYYPFGSLFADDQGNLYGTTDFGGTNGAGTVFEITDSGFVACFVAGTTIRTPDGDVPVERLAIGDLVVTASGAHRPIRWLGRRGYIGRFANRNPDILPVCFKAGSLADGVPARDLWVSPKHAMFLDGALVPAEHLVNGVSVVKATRVDRVDYHHVELDGHDVLLAEGAPSESFVDDHGRHIFHNARDHAALYPDAVRVDAAYCAPRLEHGDALEATRRRIDARAAQSASGARSLA